MSRFRRRFAADQRVVGDHLRKYGSADGTYAIGMEYLVAVLTGKGEGPVLREIWIGIMPQPTWSDLLTPTALHEMTCCGFSCRIIAANKLPE